MNYTTILVNGQKVGIKFGMASFRYLSDKFKEGKAYQNGQLTEIGISYIVYSGYYNNCLVKEEDPTLSFSDIVDWVEKAFVGTDDAAEITKVITLWSENDFIRKKDEQSTEETKKKTSRGKK